METASSTADMEFIPTAIAGAYRVRRAVRADSRGRFSRLFCSATLSRAAGMRCCMQANHSVTARAGAFRGLHFQYAPHAESKLIYCLRGAVFDVALDLRRGSATFLRLQCCELRSDSAEGLLLPEGVAHGFQALVDDSEMLYFHSAEYCSEAEGGVRFDDPRIDLTLPLPVCDLSLRDRSHAFLGDHFEGIEF